MLVWVVTLWFGAFLEKVLCRKIHILYCKLYIVLHEKLCKNHGDSYSQVRTIFGWLTLLLQWLTAYTLYLYN